MKKKGTMVLLLVLAAALVACGGGSAAADATQDAAVGGTTDAQTASGDAGAPGSITQLAVGTLSLEESNLAVTADQATALLPLWQAYRALMQSDTTAAAELQALTSQIKETMTPEQLEAIDAMDLAQEDLAAMTDKLGLRPALAAGVTPGAQYGPGSGFRQGFAGGGPPAGMPNAGGAQGAGGMPMPGGMAGEGGQGFMLDPDATLQAGRTGRAGGDRMALVFIDPLITMLEARAGGSS